MTPVSHELFLLLFPSNFHGMPCGMLLLLFGIPIPCWLRGLPEPPPDADSLKDAPDGELLAPVVPPTRGSLWRTGVGSFWRGFFVSLLPSTLKVPTVTYKLMEKAMFV